MGKGQFPMLRLVIFAVVMIALVLGIASYMGLLGRLTASDIGGVVTAAKLGKLELISTSNPVYCPASAEVACDKSAYTAVCADSNPDSIDVNAAPTEDVKCGPAKFVVGNTGDGPVNNIKVYSYSEDPNKISGKIDTGKSGWDGTNWVLSSLAAGDSVSFNVWCKYEGGQTSANEKIDITFTGTAGSGAKSGYETITAKLNCTA